MSDKPYSGIPLDERRTWVVPRLLKEVFVGFALLCVAAVAVSKLAQVFGGRLERAKAAVDAQDLEGPAPAISLPARGGGTFDLAQARGKLVLVNFWATWCEPCRAEMPSLARLASIMDPASFQLVAVSVDESWPPIDKFFGGKPTQYPVLLDAGAKTSLRYG